MNGIPQPSFPAPWQLKGKGIILTYCFDKSWVAEQGFLSADREGQFRGGLGFVMLVNYAESPVGPYKELLFIPGKFQDTRKQSITKIYVDSEDSTRNGRWNWGIPKQTAQIDWTTSGSAERIKLRLHGDTFFECLITSGGLSFPVHTCLLPIRLHQELNDRVYLTNPAGRGMAKFARLRELHVRQDFFPDIRSQRLLAAIKIDPFRMYFPQAINPASPP